MKIAVYTICKNEEANVNDWFRSANGADVAVVVDTGSTDRTVQNFERIYRHPPGGDEVGDYRFSPQLQLHKASINPWRFDVAHNVALSLVPSDVDVCIPLHLDERLEPGWREALEAKWKVGIVTKAFYTYEFAPTLVFQQNRIHARNGYVWRYPDHEGVYPWMTKEITVRIPELKITQHQDRTKDRSGILPRLHAAMIEFPNDTRVTFYYARELMYYGRHAEAAKVFEAYLKMPDNYHVVEKRQAAEHLAYCYKALGG